MRFETCFGFGGIFSQGYTITDRLRIIVMWLCWYRCHRNILYHVILWVHSEIFCINNIEVACLLEMKG